MRISSIAISADADKINSKYFSFLCDLKKLLGTYKTGSLFLEDGYYYNEDWREGGSIEITRVSDEDLEEIQQLAESHEITRLEYVFQVEKEIEAKS